MSREDLVISWFAQGLEELDGENLIELLDEASTHLTKTLAASSCEDYNDLCPMCDGSLYLAILITAAAEVLSDRSDRVEIRGADTRVVN